MSRTIIPIACHFASPSELCETTIARMHAALNALQAGDILLLAGDVPYEPNGPTLGMLMQEWLVHNCKREIHPHLVRNNVGTFSEARAITLSAAELGRDELVLVSSDWYLFAACAVWRRRARERNLRVTFIPVINTGGLRTWSLYIVIGLVIRAALLIGLERPLERFFTAMQSKRKKGFTLNGCA